MPWSEGSDRFTRVPAIPLPCKRQAPVELLLVLHVERARSTARPPNPGKIIVGRRNRDPPCFPARGHYFESTSVAPCRRNAFVAGRG